MATEVLAKGRVSRLLPQPGVDSGREGEPFRIGRYDEQFSLTTVRKTHVLADEGTYFVTHNAQTGIATSMLGTAFSQTTLSPFLLINNTDIAGGKSLYLDYVNLICTLAGAFASAGSTLMCAWSLDQIISRWASGGTDLTNVPAANGGTNNPNSGSPKKASIAQIYCGALTLNAASANARLIVPQRLFRVTNSTTVAGAAQDEVQMNFGGVERGVSGLLDLTTAKTVGYRELLNLPCIEIAPQHCAILHLWSPGQAVSTTAITYLPEIGHFER